MSLPITPESLEAFGLRRLELAQVLADNIQAAEMHLDLAFAAAILLQEHRYYELANSLFDRCKEVRKQVS